MCGVNQQEDSYHRHHVFLQHHSERQLRKKRLPTVLLSWIGFSHSMPCKPNLNSCSNCIQLIVLLLRIFPCSGCVIHLYPSQLTPAWWHMTALAWVSTNWLISPLASPLRDNGTEWQHVHNVAQALHATLATYQWRFSQKHSTTSSPRPTGHILAATFNMIIPALVFFMNMLCGRCCDDSAS